MRNTDLAKDYLKKSITRLEVLEIFFNKEDYSDVIRESQEAVELAQKAMLRQIGIDPPKWHDVGSIILEHKDKFPEEIHCNLPKIAEISKWLRKERELAFYGDIDFIPSEEYTKEDALKAIEGVKIVIETARKLIKI
ncbi:HEPN domain-containing protein [Thermodesulfovibrio yellowstonii]|uniref:DNA-binding protein n=1 Tax=Thermodesulfovibrio yellowstonii TaxID=28262 RepID=A0A9W6GIB4_9BACT|nr:HEPN domain-containing protein [Thermodesulfovibrio islandicus]GLI54291.1 DNA-binding protein [Thermodesulfovibrio islandicus]